MMRLHWQQSGMAWWPLIALVILIDGLTKYFAAHILLMEEQVSIFSHFSFTLLYNKGAAFGFLKGEKISQIFLYGLVCLFIIMLIRWLRSLPKASQKECIGICFILGGALGNFINRLYSGYVIDFLYLHGDKWSWPVFNIADCAILVGAFLVIINMRKKFP